MKYFLGIFIVLAGYFYALNESKKDLVIYYRYDGLHPEVIQRGLNQWWELRYIKFQKTDQEGLSVLKIYDVDQHKMDNTSYYGEFIGYKNIIRLNRTKTLNERQWEAVVAHEVGHLFLLGHSEDPRSVMSNNIHVNADDLKNAVKVKSLFYYKQIILNMIDKITFR
jgi:Zn-dependent protease with chaperone function